MSLYMVVYTVSRLFSYKRKKRDFSMGKDLRGKELGVGISRRKDGLYTLDWGYALKVKPLHCRNVLNQMASRYANSVIEHSRLVMWMMFDSALENELIAKNPVTKSVKCTSGRKPKEMRALRQE